MLCVIIIALLGYGKDEKQASSNSLVTTTASVSKVVSFSETQPQQILGLVLASGGDCNMERLNGITFGTETVNAKKGGDFILSGWVVDVAKNPFLIAPCMVAEGFQSLLCQSR